MKYAKTKSAFGITIIKALTDTGVVLRIEKSYAMQGRVSYSVDGKHIKHTGKTNHLFNKYFDNFAEMLQKL